MSLQTFPCPNGEICYAEECTYAKQCMHLGETTHYEQLGYTPRSDASESEAVMPSPTEGHGAPYEDDGIYSTGGLIGDIETLEHARDCGCGLEDKCPMLPHERPAL